MEAVPKTFFSSLTFVFIDAAFDTKQSIATAHVNRSGADVFPETVWSSYCHLVSPQTKIKIDHGRSKNFGESRRKRNNPVRLDYS